VTESVPSPSFAQLLRRYRRAAGLTQEELAEQANLSARAVSDLERGENRTPRRDTLDLLAEALHLSAEDRAALDLTVSRTRAGAQPREADATTAAGSGGAPVANLPPQPTRFIGRERDIEAIRARLLDPDTRLLTLTGPGGTGKTRLALQAAAAARDAFADGVFFVPLAPLSDPGLVLPTIAQALGVAESPGQAIGDTLAAALRGKRLLLLLDNFEQILPAATPVMTLLADAPTLTALATSREPLHVRGERLYPVQPLMVPRPPLPPLEALSQYEAVRLFIARAQDVAPGFAVTNETAPAVAEICARLDGLPLAIELAAARTRLLPPDALLARLSNRLKVVTGGSKDLPARQQTLRAAIDWSYSLLDPGEQILFARLAVFVGGRTLEAVEAICDVNGDLPVDVLDGVESLLDKSLLRREVGGGSEPRLVMLETIHEYARERLAASSETPQVERAHALYYLALAEEARPHLLGPQQTVWLARLEHDHDNCRAALSLWVNKGTASGESLRMVTALWRFWLMQGYFSEGRRWIEIALAKGEHASPQLRAGALNGMGNLANQQGDYKRAQMWFEESLTLRRTIDNTGDIADALNNLGVVAKNQGEYERAAALYEESLALSRESNNIVGIASALNNLGLVAYEQGDYGRSMALYEESLALKRTVGNSWGISGTLLNLANVAFARGDYEGASTLYRESLVISRDSGSRKLVAQGLEGCAWVAIARNTPYRAARLGGAADALRTTLGMPLVLSDQAFHHEAVQALHRALDVEVCATTWAAGRALSPEMAIAEALGDAENP